MELLQVPKVDYYVERGIHLGLPPTDEDIACSLRGSFLNMGLFAKLEMRPLEITLVSKLGSGVYGESLSLLIELGYSIIDISGEWSTYSLEVPVTGLDNAVKAYTCFHLGSTEPVF